MDTERMKCNQKQGKQKAETLRSGASAAGSPSGSEDGRRERKLHCYNESF